MLSLMYYNKFNFEVVPEFLYNITDSVYLTFIEYIHRRFLNDRKNITPCRGYNKRDKKR